MDCNVTRQVSKKNAPQCTQQCVQCNQQHQETYSHITYTADSYTVLSIRCVGVGLNIRGIASMEQMEQLPPPLRTPNVIHADTRFKGLID